jgi:hypothetical protein
VRFHSWDKKVVRIGHCPNQLCICRCKGGGGMEQEINTGESSKTWTLLDPAGREDKRAGLALTLRWRPAMAWECVSCVVAWACMAWAVACARVVR